MFNQNWGVKLVRTPQSGGWGQAHTKGDLVDPERKFPYFVECKNQQYWNLWGTIFDSEGPLVKWWRKAVKQAKHEDRMPLLVVGQDYQTPLVLAPLLRSIGNRPHAIVHDSEYGSLCLMRFSDFLKYYRDTIETG